MLRAARIGTPARLAARTRIMASPDPEFTRWQAAWDAPDKPRFDAGTSSPALLDLLSRHPSLASGATVLIPGCGRGYDCAAFVAAGAAAATGWDYQDTAVAAARAWLREAGAPPGATVERRDFFAEAAASKPPSFNAGYDYTFMVALPPARRPEWAAAWRSLIAPGGALITLIFPVETGDDALKQGPPWPVTPDVYRQLLQGHGFECESMAPVPPELSHRGRGGREWLAVWRREKGSKL